MIMEDFWTGAVVGIAVTLIVLGSVLALAAWRQR
jgi:hypothetical protein